MSMISFSSSNPSWPKEDQQGITSDKQSEKPIESIQSQALKNAKKLPQIKTRRESIPSKGSDSEVDSKISNEAINRYTGNKNNKILEKTKRLPGNLTYEETLNLLLNGADKKLLTKIINNRDNNFKNFVNNLLQDKKGCKLFYDKFFGDKKSEEIENYSVETAAAINKLVIQTDKQTRSYKMYVKTKKTFKNDVKEEIKDGVKKNLYTNDGVIGKDAVAASIVKARKLKKMDHEVRVTTKLLQKLFTKKRQEKKNYVFAHGQSSNFTPINMLIKELKRLENPTESYVNFQFLRHPDIMQRKNVTYNELAALWEARGGGIGFDEVFAEDLLSVDTLNSNAVGESAISYVEKNTGALINNTSAIIKKILTKYNLSEEAVINVLKEMGKLDTKADVGNLFLISVPKEETKPDENYERNFVYQAQEYGLKNQYDQEFFSLEYDSKFVTGFTNTQFRIFADKLDPKKHQIYRVTQLSKEQKTAMKTKVRELAQKIYSDYMKSMENPNPQIYNE